MKSVEFLKQNDDLESQIIDFACPAKQNQRFSTKIIELLMQKNDLES